MEYVFVYGTLKSGEPNEAVMNNPASGSHKLIGEAELCRRFPMIVSTQFNIPFVLKSPGDGKIIKGEVYSVDSQKLSSLDELENIPHFYVRERERARLLETSEEIDVWVYVIPDWRYSLVANGSEPLSSYSSEGSHGRRYVPLYIREQEIAGAEHSLIHEVRNVEPPKA